MDKKLYKRVLTLAIPMMIQNGITNAAGLVDHVMVGSLGTESMTAVSIVGQLIFVFNLAIFGGLSGPGIYSAQFFGHGNSEGVKQSFRMKIIITLFCLTAGLLLFFCAGTPLIRLYLQGESTEVDAALTTQYGLQYLRIMLLGLPAFAVTQIYASTLRETGESIKPMVAGISSIVADVLFNYLLIYGKFGFPRLGVAGAAVATVIARFVEMTVLLIWTYRKKAAYPFLDHALQTLRVPKHLTKPLLKKSLPIFCNELLWAGGVAALTQTYSIRGLHYVAGLNISNVLCNLLNVVFVAMGSAVGILIGQTLGAGKYEQAKKDAFSLTKFTGMLCLGLTGILILCSGVFPRLYETTDNIRHYAQLFIIITALFFPVQGVLNALYFTLRSGGKTLVTFLFDSMFSWVIMIPLATLLCRKTALPITVVYAVVQAADIIKVTIGAVLIRKRLWISNLAENLDGAEQT